MPPYYSVVKRMMISMLLILMYKVHGFFMTLSSIKLEVYKHYCGLRLVTIKNVI